MNYITEQNLPSIQAYLVIDTKSKLAIVCLREFAERNHSDKAELSGDLP